MTMFVREHSGHKIARELERKKRTFVYMSLNWRISDVSVIFNLSLNGRRPLVRGFTAHHVSFARSNARKLIPYDNLIAR